MGTSVIVVADAPLFSLSTDLTVPVTVLTSKIEKMRHVLSILSNKCAWKDTFPAATQFVPYAITNSRLQFAQ